MDVPKARLERPTVDRPQAMGAAFSFENSQSCDEEEVAVMLCGGTNQSRPLDVNATNVVQRSMGCFLFTGGSSPWC